MPKPRYRSALEVGCSIGVLTRLLALHCDSLLAVDAAQTPLLEAKRRCADLPSVRFEQMFVPEQWPNDAFDLIVLSEVIYYLSRWDVGRLAGRVTESLAPGGAVILVHWIGSTDYPLSGDEAVVLFIERMGLTYVVDRSDRYCRFRLDVLSHARTDLRRRASERRAINICSGNSAGLSNRRANRGLPSSITLHAAPKENSVTKSLTWLAESPSSVAQS
jgi:predicted TPR repeat methyltransferase